MNKKLLTTTALTCLTTCLTTSLSAQQTPVIWRTPAGHIKIDNHLAIGSEPSSALLSVHGSSSETANILQLTAGDFAFRFNPRPLGGGLAGLFVDKQSGNTHQAHGISFTVGGAGKWAMGLDTGNIDFVPVYLYEDEWGRYPGRDIFRFTSFIPRDRPEPIVVSLLGADGVGTPSIDPGDLTNNPTLTVVGVEKRRSIRLTDSRNSTLSIQHPTRGEVRLLADGNSQFLTFWTNLAERFRIDAAGRVGIGTSTPTATLEVNGGIRLNPTGARPTCTSSIRGELWVTPTPAGDTLSICISIGFGYTWRNITLQ